MSIQIKISFQTVYSFADVFDDGNFTVFSPASPIDIEIPLMILKVPKIPFFVHIEICWQVTVSKEVNAAAELSIERVFEILLDFSTFLPSPKKCVFQI